WWRLWGTRRGPARVGGIVVAGWGHGFPAALPARPVVVTLAARGSSPGPARPGLARPGTAPGAARRPHRQRALRRPVGPRGNPGRAPAGPWADRCGVRRGGGAALRTGTLGGRGGLPG